jgi:hypothetical protein
LQNSGENGAGEGVRTLDFHLGNPLGLVERLLLLVVYNEYFRASCQLFIDLIYSAFTTFKTTHLQWKSKARRKSS